MKIIAFGHRRGVGKDTAAGFLVTHYRTSKKNINVRKMGFAGHLKEIAHRLYGWAGLQDEEFYERNYNLKEVVIPALGKSPREIWIELGNKCREIYANTWLDLLLKGTKCDYLIIKDLRYPNEFEIVKANGGIVVRLDNPNIAKHNDVADSALANCDKWDIVIDNDKGLKELHNKVIGELGNV